MADSLQKKEMHIHHYLFINTWYCLTNWPFLKFSCSMTKDPQTISVNVYCCVPNRPKPVAYSNQVLVQDSVDEWNKQVSMNGAVPVDGWSRQNFVDLWAGTILCLGKWKGFGGLESWLGSVHWLSGWNFVDWCVNRILCVPEMDRIPGTVELHGALPNYQDGACSLG